MNILLHFLHYTNPDIWDTALHTKLQFLLNILFSTVKCCKTGLLVVEAGGEVARVHHGQDVPHLQILPGGVEREVNLTITINILTRVKSIK